MAQVTFNIDTTEDGYETFEGETLQELKEFLYPEEVFQDCCGEIVYRDKEKEMHISIAALKDYGVYLGVFDGERQYLSLADKSKLDDLLDVWGDDLYVSQGVFVSAPLAWNCICELVQTGEKGNRIEWITDEELPEDANYI